jgi:hypothetical protein
MYIQTAHIYTPHTQYHTFINTTHTSYTITHSEIHTHHTQIHTHTTTTENVHILCTHNIHK